MTRQSREDDIETRDPFGSTGKIAFEIVAPADPFLPNEDLWGGVDILPVLELVDCLARRQDAVIGLLSGVFQQLPGADSERASVVGQDHAIEGSGLRLRHGVSPPAWLASDHSAARPRLFRREWSRSTCLRRNRFRRTGKAFRRGGRIGSGTASRRHGCR